MKTITPQEAKPFEIFNLKLGKPWLVIDCYDVAFDNYLSIQTRIDRLETIKNELLTAEAVRDVELKIERLRGNQESIAANLRDIDRQLHDYIKGHQG